MSDETEYPPLHTLELIVETNDNLVERLRVCNGWLYHTRTWDPRSKLFQTALAFVADAPIPAAFLPPAPAPAAGPPAT